MFGGLEAVRGKSPRNQIDPILWICLSSPINRMKCGEKAVSYSSIYQIDSGVMLPELPHKKHGNACQQSPLTLLCSSNWRMKSFQQISLIASPLWLPIKMPAPCIMCVLLILCSSIRTMILLPFGVYFNPHFCILCMSSWILFSSVRDFLRFHSESNSRISRNDSDGAYPRPMSSGRLGYV